MKAVITVTIDVNVAQDFQRLVGKGNVSRIMQQLIEEYIKAH